MMTATTAMAETAMVTVMGMVMMLPLLPMATLLMTTTAAF
jgi:hypothetical protein